MPLPNKLFSYEQSIISKFPTILGLLSIRNLSPIDLYENVKNSIDGISEFLEIMDSLYALGKIDFDRKTGDVHYVG